MSTIKNVTLAGATGSLGSVVLEKLITSGYFNVRVLRRQGSDATFPASVQVTEVDYSSFDSLKAALEGQDALVSTLSSGGIGVQLTMIDAAFAAGVKRILPSAFGSDMRNPLTRKLPVYTDKIQVEEHILENIRKLAPGSPDVSYTFIYNSAFLDWGLQQNFLLKVNPDLTKGRPVKIYNDGNKEFSAVKLATVGSAVVTTLRRESETRNQALYIRDTVVSQNKLLALAKKAQPSNPAWSQPEYVKLADMQDAASAKFAKGQPDIKAVYANLLQSILVEEYGGKFENTHNDLLGITEITDEEVLEIVKSAIKQADLNDTSPWE